MSVHKINNLLWIFAKIQIDVFTDLTIWSRIGSVS